MRLTAHPPQSLPCSFIALVAALVVGCAQAPTEEAEHVHYDFKPVDFPDAVNKLVALQSVIASGEDPQDQPANHTQSAPDHDNEEDGDQGHDEHDGHQESSLRQWHLIVRWLPETAADSDLKRDSWERIADPAKRLFDLTHSWEQQPEEEQQELFQDHRQELTAMLQELGDLADSEYPANANTRTHSNAEEN